MISIDSDEKKQEYKDQIFWLKTNIDPWNTVEVYWKNTYKPRLDHLVNSTITYDYIGDFPILKHTTVGYKLVKIFCIVY